MARNSIFTLVSPKQQAEVKLCTHDYPKILSATISQANLANRVLFQCRAMLFFISKLKKKGFFLIGRPRDRTRELMQSTPTTVVRPLDQRDGKSKIQFQLCFTRILFRLILPCHISNDLCICVPTQIYVFISNVTSILLKMQTEVQQVYLQKATDITSLSNHVHIHIRQIIF